MLKVVRQVVVAICWRGGVFLFFFFLTSAKQLRKWASNTLSRYFREELKQRIWGKAPWGPAQLYHNFCFTFAQKCLQCLYLFIYLDFILVFFFFFLKVRQVLFFSCYFQNLFFFSFQNFDVVMSFVDFFWFILFGTHTEFLILQV